ARPGPSASSYLCSSVSICGPISILGVVIDCEFFVACNTIQHRQAFSALQKLHRKALYSPNATMGLDPKRDVDEWSEKLARADEALSPIAQMIGRHVKATEHLQRIATQLTSAKGTEALYEQIIDTALAILRADLGTLQRFCPDGSKHGRLQLL